MPRFSSNNHPHQDSGTTHPALQLGFDFLSVTEKEAPTLPPLLPPETASPAETRTPSKSDTEGISANRAARLRRIVHDGEETARRLDRLSKDLHREIPEVYRPVERGADRAADLLEDIAHAFDKAVFFAKGQARQAAERLTQADQPVRFTRQKTPPDETKNEGESDRPPLWKLFATGQEDAENGDANHPEEERGTPSWTDL